MTRIQWEFPVMEGNQQKADLLPPLTLLPPLPLDCRMTPQNGAWVGEGTGNPLPWNSVSWNLATIIAPSVCRNPLLDPTLIVARKLSPSPQRRQVPIKFTANQNRRLVGQKPPPPTLFKHLVGTKKGCGCYGVHGHHVRSWIHEKNYLDLHFMFVDISSVGDDGLYSATRLRKC